MGDLYSDCKIPVAVFQLFIFQIFCFAFSIFGRQVLFTSDLFQLPIVFKIERLQYFTTIQIHQP